LVAGSGPSHGSVSLTAPGTFTYTPNAHYNGPDSFQYTASDGTNIAGPATVSITVAPVNDPPNAANDTLNTRDDPSPAPTINVLANDTDIDGDTLTAALVPGSGPSHGSVSLT